MDIPYGRGFREGLPLICLSSYLPVYISQAIFFFLSLGFFLAPSTRGFERGIREWETAEYFVISTSVFTVFDT